MFRKLLLFVIVLSFLSCQQRSCQPLAGRFSGSLFSGVWLAQDRWTMETAKNELQQYPCVLSYDNGYICIYNFELAGDDQFLRLKADTFSTCLEVPAQTLTTENKALNISQGWGEWNNNEMILEYRIDGVERRIVRLSRVLQITNN